MTISGTTNFSIGRNQIINKALQMIRVLGEDEIATPQALGDAALSLNILMKSFENQSRHVWKRSECTLFLQKGQASYILGGTTTDNCTENYIQTIISSTALITSNTNITVASTTGMSSTQNIGICLDNNTLFWTTIASVTNSTQLVLTTGVPSSAAIGQNVYVYTSQIFKPLKIYSIRRNLVVSNNDTKAKELSYEDYTRLPNKSQIGSPLSWMYQRNINNGILYVWQPPQDVTYVYKITYAASFQDFDNTADTPDLPQEWYDVIVKGLAVLLSPQYGKSTGDTYANLKNEYREALTEALAFDVEGTYLTLDPTSH